MAGRQDTGPHTTQGHTPTGKPGRVATTHPAADLIRSMLRTNLIYPVESVALLNMTAAQQTARRTVAAGLRVLAGIADDAEDRATGLDVTAQAAAIYNALNPGLDEQERDRQWTNLRATVERIAQLEDDQRCTDLDRAEHGEYAALLKDLDGHADRILDGGTS